MTKLQEMSSALLEAGWLLLLSVIPVLVLLAAFRFVEAPKVGILRSVGLIILLGWLSQGTISWRSHKDNHQSITIVFSPAFLRQPLIIPVLLFSGAYLLATLFSTAPRLSFWGSYGRLQGAYTVGMYLVLFLLIRYNLRAWPQMRRLVDVILLSSFPVALLAILQSYELAPAIWTKAIARFRNHRSASTLGNPIFLGGYLVLVIPFTLVRLHEAVAQRREGRGVRWLAVGLYGSLLLIQEGALFLSQSRGPVVAHLISLFLLALLWAAMTGRRRLAIVTIVIASLIVLFILALNLPGIYVGLLERLRGMTRLLAVLDFRNRIIIWDSMVRLFSSNMGRMTIGYGPETLGVAVLPHLTPEAAAFADNLSQHLDRAHNATWETLGTMGFIGLVASLFLFGALFYYGLRTLGLVANKSKRRIFFVLTGFGVLVGAILSRFVTHSWSWVGLGVPAGLLAGLAAYVVGYIVLHQPTQRSRFFPQQYLVIALLGAVMAHFIEIQVAFGTTTSQLYFWVYAALIAVLASDSLDQSLGVGVSAGTEGRTSGGTQRCTYDRHPRRVPGVDQEGSGIRIGWRGVLMGGLLSTVAVSFLFLPGIPLSDLFLFFVGISAGTWFVGGLFVIMDPEPSMGSVRRRLANYTIISFVGFLLFVIVFAVAVRTAGFQISIVLYLLMLIMCAALLAVVLQKDPRGDLPFWHGRIDWIYLPLVVLLAGVIWTTNVEPVIADVYFNSGLAYVENGDQEAGIALYNKALELQPNEDIYYLRLSEAYSKLAQQTRDLARRNQWFEEARKAAWRAWQLNPGQMYHALNLAHVYLLWAQTLEAPGARTAMLDQAATLYAEAGRVLRYDPRLYREWGLALRLQGNYGEALEKYRTSLGLDSQQAETYRLVGDLYRDLGKLDAAEQALKRAAQLNPDRVDVHVALGEIYHSQDRLRRALTEAQRAVELAPRDYRLYLNLGLIYRQMGRMDEATEAVRNAQTYAPEDQQPRLEALLDQLEGTGP